MRGLKGKIAIIAGGATGMGAAAAQRLVEEGAKVVIGDINIAGAEATAARLKAAGGEVIAVKFDFKDEDTCRQLVAAAVETFGGVDLLLNAGADLSAQTLGRDKDLLSMEIDVWDRTFRTNLYGHAFTSRAAIPIMMERGGGAIVNISSGAGSGGSKVRVAYSASKAGVNSLTRHIATRYGKKNIRCNTIAPGLVQSETQQAMSKGFEEYNERSLAGISCTRLGLPSDIGAMAVFLLSDDAEWVTGQTIHVNGGGAFHG